VGSQSARATIKSGTNDVCLLPPDATTTKDLTTVDKMSVYIPAFNSAEFLSRAIDGLLAQTLPADEILVIDDGSSDATAEIAARYPGVTLVRHPYNRGLGAARNTGFSTARNELVASLDADCAPDPRWLAGLVRHFDDPKVAGVGGRLIEGNQRTIPDRWRRAHMAQEWGDQPLHNPRFLFGCNNMLRKSAVREAGGYDESMRTNGEDTDISRRLRDKGWDLLYDPEPLVLHLRHDTARSILDTYWRWWRFGVRAYANGVRLRSVLGHALFVHFRHTFLDLVRSDLNARRFDLLGLDLAALVYFPYRDFRLWLVADPKSASRQISSEV
jgi:cellulose synthase/poly-beta-1,6-N-acetylglucosamine synthase-like glycosyltransferase